MKLIKKVVVAISIAFILLVASCAKKVMPSSSDVDNDHQKLDVNKISDTLRADFFDSLNKDLVKKVSDFEKNEEVGVIITLSSDSLVNEFTSSNFNKFSDFLNSNKAKKIAKDMEDSQKSLVQTLEKRHLISSTKYYFSSILDGIYVRTTYDKIDDIIKLSGIERVFISNTYEKPNAVQNPVSVYETGIFDSSNVEYTGKGTIVAILDTGCDYTHTAFTTHEVVNPLYSRTDIENKLSKMLASSLSSGLETRDVYYSSKIPFGYDYADKDPDIMPYSSEHGTHVAGIIGGYDDRICGVAIDTQLAIMKVFSDYAEGAEDGDILAALEDAVNLGVDAINMSLGTSCGFTREEDEEYKSEIYDNIEKAGISLIAAASNDYSSAYGSEAGNTNKASNPDSGTVGAPSTYHAALSVASINGNMDKYMLANGTQNVFFLEAYNQSAKEYNFYEMLNVPANQSVVYEYVTVPGYGLSANYMGIDVKGKIALVKRGDISFEEKVQYAAEAGAIACIIYNNVFGDIVMTVGNNVQIPVVSISKDDGVQLASIPNGRIEFNMNNLAGPFMSDFSSWGPTPNLELKPEITAHGGNILSAIPGGDYDKLSGTSMAAPNMCGVAILIRQYVKEKFPNLSTEEIRDMVNQLVTSTATIALDRVGNPYSPRKQGAGLADLVKSVTTGGYLTVDGKNSAKIEFGDDKNRSGVYEFAFNVVNISNKALTYDLSSIVMTESLSTSDENYVAELGHILDGKTSFSVENGSLDGNVCTVDAGKTAIVKVKIELSNDDKIYLNRYFENGMYIEGYIKLKAHDDVDLNIPFLGFYGDWSVAPIFDKDYYEVETEAHNNAIDDDDKIKADYYATTPLGKYYYDYVIPLGSYVYDMSGNYQPIPATSEHAAVSYYVDCISGIYAVFAGLLRGAKELEIKITNTTTGEVVWEEVEYNCYKSYYSGAPRPYVADINLDAGDYGWDNNAKFEVTMSALLDWDDTSSNKNSTYSFTFYVDYEAPRILDATYRSEYDKAEKEWHYYADLTVYDNHYVQSIRPVVLYTNPESNSLTYTSLVEYPIPVYQKALGEKTVVEVEITDYIDVIKETELAEGLAFYIDDYAMNANFYYVSLPELDSNNLAFTVDTLTINKHDTVDLRDYVKVNGKDTINKDYLGNLEWSSTNENVIIAEDGIIEAINTGISTISATSKVTGKKISLVVSVVDSDENTNPSSGANVGIEALEFTSYETKFAFTSDNDYSEIGSTGSLNFFDGSPAISCYPSESVRLIYNLKPWNLDESRYTLEFVSSNERVVTVDQNGVLVAMDEGVARISLRITIDGKLSTMAARCTVTVKSPFIVENRILTEYKGFGGIVEIPDDLGIMYIGSFAFCHYTIDDSIEIEDPDDFDSKKIPYGDSTITTVIIPEGVEEIQKYAFYKCSALKKVVLPTSCKRIFEYGFYDCTKLEEINLENVVVVAERTFYNCTSLLEINASNLNTIGKEAFYRCANIRSIDIRELKRTGERAFAECSRLTTVLFGRWTKLSEGMFTNSKIVEATIYSNNIPDNAFEGCNKLTKVDFMNDLVYLGSYAFRNCTSLAEINFHGGVEYISSNMISGCSSLKNLTLPSSDVEIADYAFANSGLEKLILAQNTYFTKVGGAILANCNNLTQINVSDSKNYRVYNEMICSNDLKTIVLVMPRNGITTLNVPDSIEEIGEGALSGHLTLTTVVISNSSKLAKIASNAFAECINLQSVTLPNKALTIEDYAFYYCQKLSSINLEQVSVIGPYAFTNTNLRNITIGDNTQVNEGAFYQTNNMLNVTLGANVELGLGAFRESTVETVNMSTGGNVVIGPQTFYSARNLKTIDLTKAVGKIGDMAFYHCPKLTEIALGNVTEIGLRAFADCNNLATIDLGNTLERIGESAFASYATGSAHGALFTEIVLPDTLTYIGPDAFYDCQLLESINLNKVAYVGEQAFAYCTSLANVILGDQLKVLNDSTFFSCTSLKNINLENIERINNTVFYLTIIENINLANCQYIGQSAFHSCNALTTVLAPEVEVLAESAFQDCPLTTISLPKLVEVRAQAFYDTQITSFEVSDTLKQVDYTAFVGMNNLTEFFAYVNGEKQTTATLSNLIIDDGVLYTILPNGYYQLAQYPVAKEDDTYRVIDHTIRIEYFAAAYNQFLTKVILPMSLEAIGDFAFYASPNLTEVEFNSYYAPRLEGTMTLYSTISVDRDSFEAFDMIYGKDYYYFESEVILDYAILLYNNFVDTLGKKLKPLTYSYPENSSGYDGLMYSVYFHDKLDDEGNRITTGQTMDNYAINFLKAMEKVPDEVTINDKKTIKDARTAYNALLAHPEQLEYIPKELIDEILAKDQQLNVMIVTDLINGIYFVDASKYSYDRIRNVYTEFNNLTVDEQNLITNKAHLDQAMSELATKMGCEIDFTKEFVDYDLDIEPENPEVNPPQAKPVGLIITLVVVGVVVVATATTVTIILLKKRTGKKDEKDV